MGPGEALWPNMNGTYQKKKYFLNHEAMKTQKQCIFAKETLKKNIEKLTLSDTNRAFWERFYSNLFTVQKNTCGAFL